MVTISISARKDISGGVMPRGRGKAIGRQDFREPGETAYRDAQNLATVVHII